MMTAKEFRDFIWEFYKHNRRDFPWRNTRDPYAILVSELMLQQTQTIRVIPKFTAWLQQYPTVKALAEAPLSEVLVLWNGLGYNRRAKYLWETAKLLSQRKKFPNAKEELLRFPGIGEYTANAILAFAYDTRNLLIETNIRTVIIQHFFKNKDSVSDTEIKQILETVTPTENIRDWFYALMDYGAFLKTSAISHTEKQKGYTKQSKFAGSDRYVRGWILRELSKHQQLDRRKILIPGYEQTRIENIIDKLQKEKLILCNDSVLTFP